MNSIKIFIYLLALAIPRMLCSQVTAIKAGFLIDPESGLSSESQTILIEGPLIKAISSQVSIPGDAEVIDLSGFYVLPGLIDAHTHLCTDVEIDASWKGRITERFTSYTLQTSTAYRAITGVTKCASMLQSGFTTVRDVGNAGNYADTELRRAVENGLIQGPTIINAGRIIAPFGGQFHLHAERPELGVPEYLHADTRDELRNAIRENIHFGAKVIKIVVDDQPYIYSEEDLKFIVDEAGGAGIKVAAHCHTAQGAMNAILAGVASIEHGTHMSDDILALAKKHGVALVGTEMPIWLLELFGSEKRYPLVIDRLRRAHRLGVTLVYGSDVLYEVGEHTRGEMSLANLESWQEAGIPPLETLRAMTINAAILLGVEDERGAIKSGLAADLVAVRGNPLENTNFLKEVVFVMKNGKVVKKVQ